MSATRDLTKGNIAAELFKYFLPIAAGLWFQQLYNAVDAIVVGKYVGTAALAAVGGSSSHIVTLLVGFFVSLTSGAAIIIAHLYGADDRKDLTAAVGTGVAMCIIGGAVIMVVCILVAPLLLKAMQTPEDTIEGSLVYLRIYFLGTIFQLLTNMQSETLRAAGDSRDPFIFMLISCLVNIVLDLAFVLVFGLGVAGVAIATVASQLTNAILVTHRLLTIDDTIRLVPGSIRIDKGLFKRMMRYGIPSGLQGSMYNISNLMLQAGVNLLGTTVAASWALSGKVDGFYWSTTNALGIAITNFVGQNYGAGKYDRVRSSVKSSLALSLSMTLVLSGAILLLADAALYCFTDDADVHSSTLQIIHTIVPLYFTWSFVEVFQGTLRGIGDVGTPVIILLLGVCVSRIVWLFTAFAINRTLFTLCLCYPLSWTITAIALMIYYRHRMKAGLGPVK